MGFAEKLAVALEYEAARLSAEDVNRDSDGPTADYNRQDLDDRPRSTHVYDHAASGSQTFITKGQGGRASLVSSLIKVLNPFEHGNFGGSGDYIAPETVANKQPFDEDMISYFWSAARVTDPAMAKLWVPAVRKYRAFEQACEDILREDDQRRRQPRLLGKVDRILFRRILDGVERINNVLTHTEVSNIPEVVATFRDFRSYVLRVAPIIMRRLN